MSLQIKRASVKAIANWFISKAIKENVKLDQIKLMNLIYIAQGIGLAVDNPLFSEPIEAWKYGPVVGDIYREFKYAGMESITKLIS